jgi:mercuric ion transport protein
MNNESLATGGAIAASLLIGSCCVVPTLFLVFGVSISSLGALSALEPFRPIFIAVGFAALVYAGLRIYRDSPPTQCDDGSCNLPSQSRRLLRRIFPVALFLFATSIAYPYVLSALL